MADAAMQRRGGGGAARRAERTAVRIEAARYITRNIPDLEVLNEEALAIIEANAETVLQEIGVNFVDNPGALALWREAGADVQGERVHMPRGLARTLCATAPRTFTQHARNPERNVEIGGRNLVLAPVYGPPFVRTATEGRRYATMDDFRMFVKLGYMSKWVHHSGGTLCEPTDIAVNKRHLDMLHAHMTLSDKPYMGSVTEPSRAADSVAMSEVLFGRDFVHDNTVMTSLININSPLTFDSTMMGALEVYARANQATIISPFIVGGAMAPVSVAGTLTQVLAEVMAGVAYSQLVRPGAPVIFGAFVTSIDMNSGAPTFGTPEASMITYGAGQLARRLGLPYRSGGAFCGSKLPDAQAAYESANSLNAALLSGSTSCSTPAAGWKAGWWPAPRSSSWTPTSSASFTTWRRAWMSPRTARRWTRSARWGPGGTTWAARTPRPTSRRRSGGRGFSTTSRSRPGTTRANATPSRSPGTGRTGFSPTTWPRRSIPAWPRRWPSSWRGGRPPSPTPSADRLRRDAALGDERGQHLHMPGGAVGRAALAPHGVDLGLALHQRLHGLPRTGWRVGGEHALQVAFARVVGKPEPCRADQKPRAAEAVQPCLNVCHRCSSGCARDDEGAARALRRERLLRSVG
jgi:trimethylamine---corrinoid protein Co-methyltransferase